jgi:DNA-binding beta-propeller fold protein YncE
MVIRARLTPLLMLLPARAGVQSSASSPAWSVVADVPLPGKPARFDYQSLDPATGLLWIAHMGADEVLGFDTRTRRVVARVAAMEGVTGVRAVPSLGRVFAALSAGRQVAVLDGRDGRVIARVPGGRFPDGLAYAPEARKLYVSDEFGQQELVVDARTSTPRRPIPLGGEAGNTQYDAVASRVWVAVQSRNELAAIDPRLDSIVDRVAVPGIEHPHGFLVDADHRLIYVTGEANGRLGVLDLRTMRMGRTYRVGDRPDVLALDPERRRLYVAAESGVISAFNIRGDALVPLAQYQAPHAHSVAVDPVTHLVYVPLQNVAGRPVLRVLRLE